MKWHKSFKAALALALAIITALLAPAQALAADNNGKYVSEVYVAYGKNAEEAKQTLQAKGFTPVEGNLNDGGDTYAMMGYKTTDNIRDSITDLAVMNMRGSYSVEEYRTLLRSQKTQIAEFLEEFMAVIQEYRVNLKAGKEKATYVHDLLNNYKDDDTGMLMGDLLNSETLQDKVGIVNSIDAENPDKLPDLVTILLQGNAQVIKSMEVLLAMATDTADNTWLDRFAELDYDALLDKVEDERPDLNTETKRVQYLENTYGGEAESIGLQLSEIRAKLTAYEEGGLQIDTATDEEIKNVFKDLNENAETAVNYQEWLTVGTIYLGLKNYEGGRFEKGEMLDFFLDENDPEDMELFIPMAAALSEGQRCGMAFVSLEKYLSYAFTTDEGWKQDVDKSKTSFNGLDEISVYQNIDRGLYKEDGSVALTDSAQRANNIAEGTTGTETEKEDSLIMIAAISWAATAGCTIASVIAVKKAAALKAVAVLDDGQVSDDLLYIFSSREGLKEFKMNAEGGAIVDEVAAPINRALFARTLSRILIFATVALAVASTVLTIIELCRVDEIEQLPIPNYLVDNYTDADGGSYSLNYKAVECNRAEYFGADYKKQKGSCADLLADEGKQWLALYASKNSKAGKPLTPDFAVQESSTAPGGYEGNVHIIGEKGAVNVVSDAFKNYSTISQAWQTVAGDYTQYIFYKFSNDVKTYDEAAGNMTATAMSRGKLAIFGVGGLALGAALGAVVTSLVKKKKKADS